MKFSELISEIIQNSSIEAGEEVLSKFENYKHQISTERYEIVSDSQAKFYGKEKGVYDLISLPDVLYLTQSQLEYSVQIVEKRLKDILGKVKSTDKVLVVGLGNRHISSDSLGVSVVSKVNVTFNVKKFPHVMAICPSVLGLTGIETFDIVSGVIDKVKPNVLILIDSLCASSEERLGKSIQLSNTGICPGSGIGNNRKCIDKKLAEKVVSIGVPLLIYADTFVSSAFEKNKIDNDRFESIMHTIKKSRDNPLIYDFIQDVKNAYNSTFENVIVSIKDISECVEILSDIIASAINRVLGVDCIKKIY